jgi:hypothetical protein
VAPVGPAGPCGPAPPSANAIDADACVTRTVPSDPLVSVTVSGEIGVSVIRIAQLVVWRSITRISTFSV